MESKRKGGDVWGGAATRRAEFSRVWVNVFCGLGGFHCGPSVVVVIKLEAAVWMTSYDPETLRPPCNAAFPPHAANGATLDKGGLVEVRELDAFDDVAVAAQDEAHVILVENFANLVGVIHQ